MRDKQEIQATLCSRARSLHADAVSRRKAIYTLLAGGCFAAFCETSVAENVEQPKATLKELALRDGGRYFGTAVQLVQLRGEPDLESATLGECSQITPELSLKWAALEPERGSLLLLAMDELTAYALAHNLKVRGHTLLWHKSVPNWLNDYLASEKDWGIIRKHFGSIIPRYEETIQEWDVVNEPIETGNRSDGLRENAFLLAFGPDYIAKALEEARSFAPKAKLMINEFGLEYETALEKGRRYSLLKLIERLKKANSPLDGIGIQAHLDLGKGKFSEKSYANFLAELAGFGLEIAVTELDVKEYDYVASADARDVRVAQEIKRYLDVVLAQSAVRGVSTWGLTDRHSWLEVTAEDRKRFPKAWQSGESPGFNRGLPFDSSMRPKVAYRAISTAFRRQPLG